MEKKKKSLFQNEDIHFKQSEAASEITERMQPPQEVHINLYCI